MGYTMSLSKLSMEPGVCYRTYRLCSAHFKPTQYMGKRLINNAKPSIFNWSNSSKIDTKTNLAFEPEEIKTFSSQIKGEYFYLIGIKI